MDYEDYIPGLDALEHLIGEDDELLAEFDSYKSQLRIIIDDNRKYGDRSNGISRVIDNFNRLARNLAGQSFVDFCDDAKPKRIVDLGDPANFDLDQFDECLELLVSSPGLIGISVVISEASTRNFPKYLQKRLQATLAHFGSEECFVPPTLSLKASLGSIDALMSDLAPYQLRLNTTDILLTVRADDEGRLQRFWEKLTFTFNKSFRYSFLVLIIKEHAFASPQTVGRDFDAPVFKRVDVWKWVTSLTNNLTDDRDTKKELIQKWTQAILQGCCDHEKLHTDRVYDHIEMSLDCLKRQSNSINALYKFFDEWNQLYAQTPP